MRHALPMPLVVYYLTEMYNNLVRREKTPDEVCSDQEETVRIKFDQTGNLRAEYAAALKGAIDLLLESSYNKAKVLSLTKEEPPLP